MITDLPYVALALLETDVQDRVYYQVREDGRDLVTGYSDLPVPRGESRPETPLYYDATYRGETIRVAARYIFVGPLENKKEVLVQVAETVGKRKTLVREILGGILLFQGLMILLTVGVVWGSVRHGLSPLWRLRDEIVGRSPEDLTRIGMADAPEELAPLVDAINRMMFRLSRVWEVQRRFLADASHQLKTPLTMFRAQAEIALRQESLEAMRDSLEELHRNTQSTGRLVSQMLILARSEQGTEQALSLRLLDLARLARETCMERVPMAIGTGVDLGFEGEAAAEILGEEFLLKELLGNLIDNAVHHGRKGGKVTVGVRKVEDGTALIVEDDGPGIPLRERENVFERFYRVPGTPGEGSGLGLSIVRQIANVHHAAVHLKDAPGDGGLLVEVRFPPASRGDA